MIGPVSGSRPVDVLRQSSDQIRRAAAFLAELTDETHVSSVEPVATPFQGGLGGDADDALAAREATIQQAQRSFAAGLRVIQTQVRRAARRRPGPNPQSEPEEQ